MFPFDIPVRDREWNDCVENEQVSAVWLDNPLISATNIKYKRNYSVHKGIWGFGVAVKPPHQTPILWQQGCLSSYI